MVYKKAANMCMIFILIVVLASMDDLTKVLANDKVPTELKGFVGGLYTEFNNIRADIEDVKGESYCREIQIYYVKDSINAVANSAVVFVWSVHELFCFSKQTNFLEIKKNVTKGNMAPLQHFIALMDKYLQQIGIKYESFRTDCKTAMEECGEAAERCYKLQAKANTRKKASRVIGGTATTAAIVGGTVASIAAGIFTFGIGTAIGLPLTAAVSGTVGTVTHIVAKDYAKMEDVFRSYSTKFNSLLSIALDIKDQAVSAHMEVQKFENRYSHLQYTHYYSYAAICAMLDKLQSISGTNSEMTEESLQEIKRCKEMVNSI